MNQNLLLQDANLIATGALPAATASTTSTSALDLGENVNPNGALDQFVPERVNFNLNAPALSVTEAPNGDTVTYNIMTSANANLSSPTTLIAGAVVQTGAGGVGAAAVNYQFALPANVQRYLFANAVTGTGTGNCSGSTMTLSARF